jgi:hypothetical protein
MELEHAANVFRVYKQEENNFTNGLCSATRLAMRRSSGDMVRMAWSNASSNSKSSIVGCVADSAGQLVAGDIFD